MMDLRLFSETKLRTKFDTINGYSGKIKTTKNTYSIHHFSAAWKKNSFKNKMNKLLHLLVQNLIGKKNFNLIMYRLRTKKQIIEFEKGESL